MPLKVPSPEPQWPPRSPHEALLGTPRGRQRFKRMGSTTPSPVKRSSTTHALNSRSANPNMDGLDEELDEEDDEETLQLKLQALQARLKLKKLQNAKARRAVGAASDGGKDPEAGPEASVAPLSRAAPRRPNRSPSRTDAFGSPRRTKRSQSPSAIQVPASPVRKAQPAQDQSSPKRVLLGIDKGLRGRDVSLKRAPNVRQQCDSLHIRQEEGAYHRRARTLAPSGSGAPRPLTFNERLASARTEEANQAQKRERIQKLRTNAFDLGPEAMEQYKTAAVDIPDIPLKPPEFTRDEVLSSLSKPKGGYLHRSNTAPTIGSQTPRDRPASGIGSIGSPELGSLPLPVEGMEEAVPGDVSEADASAFEPYSSVHLSKRILPHPVLTRAISGKKTYGLKDLLRQVKAPNFELPDVEQDVVIFGIVASKSDPRHHKAGLDKNGKPKETERGKYMVLTLVDLTFEMELFLFSTGFDRFWKLTPGTLVAILNPTIMPPPPGRIDTGRFSLVINSDADTILEVGTARDLGYCRSMKKDGSLCDTWVNARRTEYCEFHTNEAVRKQRGGRIELNQTDLGRGGRGPRQKRNPKYLSGQEGSKSQYDRETHSHWFVSSAQSTSALIDREGGLADRQERSEALKRRLSQKEHERNIAKRLGETGAGAGRDYMRLSEAKSSAATSKGSNRGGKGGNSMRSGMASSNFSGPTPRSGQAAGPAEDQRRKVDANMLGLLASKGREANIRLSPIKRKRPESSQSSSTVGSSTTAGKSALGWGNNLKEKLTRWKEGENMKSHSGTTSISSSDCRIDQAPVRKKTRFVTEKGIREAGRESLGAELSIGSKRQVVLDEDDDDDLVIVK